MVIASWGINYKHLISSSSSLSRKLPFQSIHSYELGNIFDKFGLVFFGWGQQCIMQNVRKLRPLVNELTFSRVSKTQAFEYKDNFKIRTVHKLQD
ncbi:hypothetical protein TNIN_276831 [Trichonephila inaurata madagascariensis]|uniref:Uncharacterized protein n=1 Tax=Trichonephila inaurata madagascariensis TaxID=2747483 RepID=A0A8X6XUE9_9ARAC|nr:hypothetical protein TNIN_276831 [Trichonephila inaurata madagascariensis]